MSKQTHYYIPISANHPVSGTYTVSALSSASSTPLASKHAALPDQVSQRFIVALYGVALCLRSAYLLPIRSINLFIFLFLASLLLFYAAIPNQVLRTDDSAGLSLHPHVP